MPRNAAAYDEDFYAWAQEQARLLRSNDLNEVDAENLAEEIESMGQNNRRELRSRLGVLLMHLLKCLVQPGEPSKSWVATIQVQRDEIEALLDDSPSLRRPVAELITRVYPKARRLAAIECNLPIAQFPDICPFTTEQVLADEFLPGGEE